MANGGKVIIKILGDDKGFKSTVKSVKNTAVKTLSVTTKAITAGTAALGGAIGFIGKQAISAYGDYEQLVGGVETLYKNSADTIIKNAQGAFKTAQMSSNEYMETVTGFAASLLQSLSGDTEKAAAMSDMALEDMADNANKMGTAMESIKWAYQGFAKQNYTMLDNLKLGYGGTKQEMERLVNDAAKLDKSVQANNLSFANIVNAVHAVQTEMGITGTTAREAATTIQGSFNTLKASWQNLMTGLTDPNQNLDKLTSDVFESFKTFAGNVAPRLESVIPAVLAGSERLCDSLVELLRKNSRRIGSTAAQLAGSLVSGFTKNAPKIVQAGKNIISGFADGVTSQFPKLTAAAKSAAMITGTIFAVQKINTGVSVAAGALKTIQTAVNGYTAAMTATGAMATRGITINTLYAASLKPLELIYGVLTGQISLATAATAAQTNAQVALNTALSANPIGIAVTAVAALAAGVYYADKAYDAWLDKHSELVQFANDIAQGAREATERTKELTGSITSLTENASANISDIEAEAYANQTLTDELYNLAGQAVITADEKARMRDIVDDLNGSIDGLNLKLDDETGQLNLTKDAVTDLINKKLEMAKANAVMDLYTEQLKNQYKAQAEAATQAGKLKEAEEKLAEIQAQGQTYLETRGGATREVTTYTEEQTRAMNELRDSISGYKDNLGNIQGALSDSMTNLENLAAVTGVTLPESFEESKAKSQGFFDALSEQTGIASAQSPAEGENYANGYINSVNSKLAEAYQAGWNLGKETLRGTREAQDSHSPAKETIKLCDYFGEGYVIGIDSKQADAWKSGSKLSKRAIAGLKKGITDGKSDVSELLTGLISDNRTNVQKVFDAMNEPMLESEKRYAEESERIEREKAQAEYEQKLREAKTAKQREKIKQDYINEQAEDGQKKYLEGLKETADAERKLYDALQKDIENNKKTVIDAYTELLEAAKDKIDDVAAAQDKMREKLASFGNLFTKNTLELDGASYEWFSLADLSEQNRQLAEYADALERVKQRGDIPAEFLDELRDMSVEEGAMAANALLAASDDKFVEYMDRYREKQAAADRISKALYRDEAKEAADSIAGALHDLDEDVKAAGEENAKAWGEGFLEQLGEVMRRSQAQIDDMLSSVTLKLSDFGIGGSGSVTTNNYTYNLLASRGESSRGQIEAIRREDQYNKQRGGY